jgi:phosphoglycerate dehydrogenase-like enzyme
MPAQKTTSINVPRPLVIASSLINEQNERIAVHRSRPQVIKVATPWEVPAEADVLFTYQTQWRTAPLSAPACWPGKLRWIQVASAGLDTFPPWFFSSPIVTRGRGVQAPAIAEYVIAAIMAHEKKFWDGAVRSAADWKHRHLGRVAGKTVGIAGFGAIGLEIAARAAPLGLRMKAVTRSNPVSRSDIEQVDSIEDLLASCDHVVLAMPLTPETRALVNRDRLSVARPGLHLINVARGAIIDEAALLWALDTGLLAAATLDVTAPEPLPAGHPFYIHPAIRLTPHISGMSEDSEDRLGALLLENLERFVSGASLMGIVDPDRHY